MEIFRFMSKSEFKAYMSGKTLKNNKDHSNYSKSNSKGFCFMSLDDHKPEEAYHFLSGLVSPDYCVKFRTNAKLKKTWGVYADHRKDGEKFKNGVTIKDFLDLFDMILGFKSNDNATIKQDEYCISEYSKDNFELIEYTVPEWGEDNWNWRNKDEI